MLGRRKKSYAWEEKLRRDLNLLSLVRTQLWGHPVAVPKHIQ